MVKKLLVKKMRGEIMAKRYMNMESTVSIGKDFDVTRTRVEQLMKPYLTDLMRAERQARKDLAIILKNWGTMERYNRHMAIKRGELKVWQTNYDQCIICGTTTTPYASNGCCRKCVYMWKYRTDPKRREQIKISSHKYYIENTEKIKASQKAYQLANKEKMNIYRTKYYELKKTNKKPKQGVAQRGRPRKDSSQPAKVQKPVSLQAS